MTNLNILLTDQLREWIQQRVTSGDYASASDYIHDLIHDRSRRQSLDQQLRRLRASSGDAEALDYIDAAFTPE